MSHLLFNFIRELRDAIFQLAQNSYFLKLSINMLYKFLSRKLMQMLKSLNHQVGRYIFILRFTAKGFC